MIKRENFYSILINTLNQHYKEDDLCFTMSNDHHIGTVLCVYNKLNAIISTDPSKEVIRYLKNEYSLNAFIIKRIAVNFYTEACFKSKGFFSKKIKLSTKHNISYDSTNLMIFPCNKKIRVFNFLSKTVDVLLKDNFPRSAMINEIKARNAHNSVHIKPILEYGDKWYREEIINGVPLARITNPEKYHCFKKKAFDALVSIRKNHSLKKNVQLYINDLFQSIGKLMQITLIGKQMIIQRIYMIISILKNELSEFDSEITMNLSHGDFHHGNIWIENETSKIILIDWEAYDQRSEWYDLFVLYGGLRETEGLKRFLKKNTSFPTELARLVDRNKFHHICFLVLIEDLFFRLNDLKNNPPGVGIHEIDFYSKELLRSISSLRQ